MSVADAPPKEDRDIASVGVIDASPQPADLPSSRLSFDASPLASPPLRPVPHPPRNQGLSILIGLLTLLLLAICALLVFLFS